METETLGALAEPTRMRIVELLRNGPLTVGEITNKLQIRQPQASKHLKVLNEAKIVDVHPVANRRFYKLRPQPLQEMDTWLSTFRSLWENQFDQLDEYLTKLQNQSNREE
ncbi:ArsR/SmtB family transcription factor [Cohnella terricola]|uniref:Winged helix-turn-helix transcriptional regulator n=1 Tax=Cohnella terricola TaxID=1289167 RepID=A0A559J546_9BACL|nr:metalloregulator ArsR/SmtB family transcription factor [Cohnella terricola]TVX95014.1 winged helix-turn-helix transcriptional regulator [Cohnella terricola]